MSFRVLERLRCGSPQKCPMAGACPFRFVALQKEPKKFACWCVASRPAWFVALFVQKPLKPANKLATAGLTLDAEALLLQSQGLADEKALHKNVPCSWREDLCRVILTGFSSSYSGDGGCRNNGSHRRLARTDRCRWRSVRRRQLLPGPDDQANQAGSGEGLGAQGAPESSSGKTLAAKLHKRRGSHKPSRSLV